MAVRDGTITVSGLTMESALQPALDMLTESNRDYYVAHPYARSVLDPVARVRYRPEPRTWRSEHFDSVDIVLRRLWGDCDDLAPAVAGELRAAGRDARAVAHWTGTVYHVVVETPDAVIDPSAILFLREVYPWHPSAL